MEAGNRPDERETATLLYSAGGVPFRTSTDGLQFAMCKSFAGHWVLPKGRLESGESSEEAATREVFEETGLSTRVVCHLGDVRYRFEAAGSRLSKRVDHYLLAVVGGKLRHNPEEHLESEWFDPANARRVARFKSEIGILDSAEQAIAGATDAGAEMVREGYRDGSGT